MPHSNGKKTVAKPPLSHSIPGKPSHPFSSRFLHLQRQLSQLCKPTAAAGTPSHSGGRISAFHPATPGPRGGCLGSKDVKRWENTVSCSRSKPRFVIEKFHQGQSSPEFFCVSKCLAVVNPIRETPHIWTLRNCIKLPTSVDFQSLTNIETLFSTSL